MRSRVDARALLLAALLGACANAVDEGEEDLSATPDTGSGQEESDDAVRSAGPRFAPRTNSLFANVLDRKETGWASVRDLSSSDFGADFDKRRAAGMMPVDLDVIE